MTFVLPKAMVLWSMLAAAVVESEESCSYYSVKFDVTYPDNVAVKCSDEDMELISNVVHSIVELDVIAAQVDRSVPEFDVAYEVYDGVVTIDSTGKLLNPIDAETIANHLTMEDRIEDAYYDPDTELITTGVPTGVPTGALATGSTFAPTSTPTAAPSGAARRLGQPWEKENKNEEQSPAAANWQPEHDKRRNLQRINGCPLNRHCTASWCCWLCGMGCRRRRLFEIVTLRTSVNSGEEDDQLYYRRVEAMELRVREQLQRKLRFLARKEAVPCLGNYWELQVFFETNLKNLVSL